MEMNLEATGSENEVLEARVLTDAELDEVNGGLIFAVLGLLGGFGAGFAGAWIAANYAVTGNFWGDLD
jgi:hypothetical protein